MIKPRYFLFLIFVLSIPIKANEIMGEFGLKFGQKIEGDVSNNSHLGILFKPTNKALGKFDEYYYKITNSSKLVSTVAAYKRNLENCSFKDTVEKELDKKYYNFKKEGGVPRIKEATYYLDFNMNSATLHCSPNKKNNTWSVSLLLLSRSMIRLGAIERMKARQVNSKNH